MNIVVYSILDSILLANTDHKDRIPHYIFNKHVFFLLEDQKGEQYFFSATHLYSLYLMYTCHVLNNSPMYYVKKQTGSNVY